MLKRKQKSQKFSITNMLSVFYSTPNEQLDISHFEDVLEAIVSNFKNKPDILTPELLRYFYKYVAFKREYSIIEILNLISDRN